jgi:hypothetical protein
MPLNGDFVGLMGSLGWVVVNSLWQCFCALIQLCFLARILFNSPWQCLCALFTLDGRCDMSLQKYSANTRERCE